MPSIQDLLVQTSRTFALAIPLLPEPTRNTTSLAYLLFRIADTLEDAETWPRIQRQAALAEFGELLTSPNRDKAKAMSRRWLEANPTSHAGYRNLLEAVPEVMDQVERLEAVDRRIVLDHALRTESGMRQVLDRADAAGRVRIETLEELKAYCYVVAGIVGELLTALFVHNAPSLRSVERTLLDHQLEFGEGLQLVNILKDESVDRGEGRSYLPVAVPRAEVLELAKSDLAGARRYIAALREGGAPRGFVSFTALSEELAEASLVRLERDGPGAKVSRVEVFQILARVQQL
jgi:farnesyl-diphosphate farnesyltransferase